MDARTALTSRKKFRLTGGVILLILILTAYILLNLYINPLAKNIFLKEAAPYLGGNLQIGAVNLSLWRGSLIVRNVALKQPPGFGGGELLKANSIRVRVAFRPLLHKQLLIKGLTFDRPEINFQQLSDGRTNTEYYLSKFQSVPVSGGKPFRLRLDKIAARNGKFNLSSPRLSEAQPTLSIGHLQARVEDLNIPNEEKLSSAFEINGVISSASPARFKISGSGVFLAGPISFKTRTKIDNLVLNEYTRLYPPTNLTVKSGTACAIANSECKNNYLVSRQQVAIKKLKVSTKKDGLAGKTFIGAPVNVFSKLIQDQNGALNFDFVVSGYLSDLKVNLKKAVVHSITASLKSKFKPIVGTEKKTITIIKKSGAKVKNSFKKLFNR